VRDDAFLCPECGAVLNAATLVSPTGFDPSRVLSDRYVLLALLGRGGMGAVWLAKDTQLDEIVAVKVLPTEVASDLRAVEWMKEEVRLARTLRHDNIAAIYSFDVDHQKQTSFIVMEFIDGVDLHALLGKHKKEGGGGLPLGMVVELLAGMAAALDYAHSKRVIHRDIKPKNIMVTRDGVVKVTDFGIARRLRETVSKISQTVVAGTPVYMAPEAIEGERIDPRADIYSLGATVYELLTGEPPFRGAGMDLVYKILKKDVPPIEPRLVGDARVAQALTAVMRKCLAKSPDERYATATKFYEDFASATAGRLSEAVLTAHRTTLLAEVGTIVAEQRRVMVGPTASVAGTPTAGGAVATPATSAGLASTPQAVVTAAEPTRKSRLPVMLAVAALLIGAAVVTFLLLSGKPSVMRDALAEAKAAAEKGDWELAVAAAKKALQKSPDDPVAKALLEKARRKLNLKRLLASAEIAMADMKLQKALKSAQEALKLEPDSKEAQALLKKIEQKIRFGEKLSSAKDAEERGFLDKAVALLDEALQLGQTEEARRLHKEWSARLRRFKEAKSALERALKNADIEGAKQALRQAKEAWRTAPELARLARRLAQLEARLVAGRKRVAVAEFDVDRGVGLSGRAAAEALLKGLSLNMQVLDATTTAGMLQALGLTVKQLADMDSAAQLWSRRGVRYLLRGAIIRTPSTYTVKVWLVDLKNRRVLRTHSHDCRDASGLAAVCQLCGRVISLPDAQREVFLKYTQALNRQDYDTAVVTLLDAKKRFGEEGIWAHEMVYLRGRLLGQARSAARLGKTKKALKFATLLLRLDTKDTEATALKAALQERLTFAPKLLNAIKSGDFATAAKLARRLKRFPENKDWLRGALLLAVSELRGKAKAADAGGRKGEAVAYARAVLALVGQDKVAERILRQHNAATVDATALQIARYVKAGRWADAVRAALAAKDSPAAERVLKLFNARHTLMRESATIGGRIGVVSALAFSSDDRLLAVGGSDGLVRLFLWQRGKESAVLKDAKGVIDKVSFSPNGRWIAAVGSDLFVHLWSTKTLQQEKALSGHKGRIQGLVWSPNSRFLVSVSWDGTVRVWNVEKFECVKTLRVGRLPGVCAWSSDGGLLAVDTSPRDPYAVTLFDTSNFKVMRVLAGHKHYITALTFSPSGCLASGGRDGQVIIWDTKSAKPITGLQGPVSERGKSEVVDLAWSPDGLYLAGCFSDGSLILWKVRKGKLQEEARWNCGGGERVRRAVGAVCWSRSGTALAAVVNGRKVKVWTVPDEQLNRLRSDMEKLLSGTATGADVKVGLSDTVMHKIERRLLGR